MNQSLETYTALVFGNIGIAFDSNISEILALASNA